MGRRCAALVVGLALGALAWPAGASAATVSCGQVITKDTTLANDLHCVGQGSFSDGIVIGAPRITLDLGGHDIYSDHVAILNEGHDDVTIRNGSVAGEYFSIRLIGAARNELRDLSVGGFQVGVLGTHADRTRIISNEFRDVGISLESDRSTISDNSGGNAPSRGSRRTSVQAATHCPTMGHCFRSGVRTGTRRLVGSSSRGSSSSRKTYSPDGDDKQ